MVYDFIPTKYSPVLATADVAEGHTFEQTEVKIAVWILTGVVKHFLYLF